jgi:cobalt-zinc-cadmium efflux system outer membrane protein
MKTAALVFASLLLSATAYGQTLPLMGPPMTLQELEQLALQNNPTPTAAASAIDAARGRARQAGAWPNPVIGYSGEEITKRGDIDPRGEHGFFVEQTIPLGGKLRLSRAVFERTITQAEAIQDLQRLRILSSVRQTYCELLLSERRIEVQERLAALASEAVAVTAQLFNVGAADRPDFLESEVESRRVQLDLNRAKNDLFAARQRLAALTGTRDVANRPLAGTLEAAIPELEREQMVQALLTQSPAIRAARAALERTRAVTARARRETFPDLFLRGGAAYNREHGEDTGQPIGWEGNVEAGISIPLFNRNAGGVAAARADETRALAEVTRLELSLQSRAAAEFGSYLSAIRESEAYRADILPRAEEAYRLYLTRYREMAAAYPQVLVAQRTLFEMSNQYLESLDDAWRSALRLQGFLAGEGLDTPTSAEGDADVPVTGGKPGGER